MDRSGVNVVCSKFASCSILCELEIFWLQLCVVCGLCMTV